MRRIGLYFACWVVLNIFEERNGINHGKNRSNAEQGLLGSWTTTDKSTLQCSQLLCILVVSGVLKYVLPFTSYIYILYVGLGRAETSS